MSRATNDIDNLNNALTSKYYTNTFKYIITIIGATVGMFLYVNPIMALATFIIIPIMFL